MIKRRTALSVVVILGLAPLCAAAEGFLTGDTFVNAGSPTNNFGSQPTMTVAAGSTALVQFSLASLPGGLNAGAITKAVLLLYVNRVGAAGAIQVSSLNGGFNELSATYAAPPTI